LQVDRITVIEMGLLLGQAFEYVHEFYKSLHIDHRVVFAVLEGKDVSKTQVDRILVTNKPFFYLLFTLSDS
jgi:hypothetical protein